MGHFILTIGKTIILKADTPVEFFGYVAIDFASRWMIITEFSNKN